MNGGGARSRSCQGLVAAGLACALAVVLGALAGPPGATAQSSSLPPGFVKTEAFSGLTEPTVIRFAPNGRVYIAEKSGLIKTYDSLSDPTPSVFADLRTQVHNFWDRGLLGMSIDFYYDRYPWVYVLYAHDAEIGGTAPRWGSPGVTSDPCPNPPGATSDGCVVSGRLSRLRSATGEVMSQENVLVEDWCQQYPSHSTGALEHDRWGALWASGGDGASFTFTDYGQQGSPKNPCGDPPVPVGGTQSAPTAEGGALRSQDLRTSSDPTGLAGTVIRVQANNGAGIPKNPLYGSGNANERRIVAYGLRNPFRFALPKHLTEMYVGDVGWNEWEEINRFGLNSGLFNFGWPCYEGNGKQSGYDSANLNICENLYGTSDHVGPLFTYRHSNTVAPSDGCPTGSSSIAGLEFYYGSDFPAEYDKALFFADYSRDCIWVMSAGADGRPDPSTVRVFERGASNPVNLEVGPDGALYYPDFNGGKIWRIEHVPGNQTPVAVASADPTGGAAPLTVDFDGTGSSDPDGDPLTYAWDLDGDGQYDDSTSATPSFTYTQTGNVVVGLRVSDDEGASATATVTIFVGNTKPRAQIDGPAPDLRWRVGEQVNFLGNGTDPEQGVLPATAFEWNLVLHHCPSNCHEHSVQSFSGVTSGSFPAPDHEYPSFLELTLTVTDSGGLQDSASVQLDPRTADVTMALAQPWFAPLSLALNGETAPAPFTRTVIEGSRNTISAPSPQVGAGGHTYDWVRWWYGDAYTQTRTVTVSGPITYTAAYARR